MNTIVPLGLLGYDQEPYSIQLSVREESIGYTTNRPEAKKKLLNINELAEMYGLKHWTIRTYCSQEKIPFIKIGQRVYFDPAAIESWIQGHARPVKEVHLP